MTTRPGEPRNICDDCLKERTDRIARHKRFRSIHINRFFIGREWVKREMVPYFDGSEDQDEVEISVDEIAEFEGRKNVELFTEQVAFARAHRDSLEAS